MRSGLETKSQRIAELEETVARIIRRLDNIDARIQSLLVSLQMHETHLHFPQGVGERTR